MSAQNEYNFAWVSKANKAFNDDDRAHFNRMLNDLYLQASQVWERTEITNDAAMQAAEKLKATIRRIPFVAK